MESDVHVVDTGWSSHLPQELWERLSGGVAVRDQAELDEALAAPDVHMIVVEAAGLTVSAAPPSDAAVMAKADIQVAGGRVYARGDVHVVAGGHALVDAEEQAQVTASGRVVVRARGEARVVAHERAHVDAWEQAHVTAHDHAHADVYGQAHVTAYDQVHVDASDQTQVTAFGSTAVKARHGAWVWAGGEVRVAAVDRVTVTGDGEAIRIWATPGVSVDALPPAVIRVPEDDCTINLDWTTMDRLWQESHQSAGSGGSV
ncbi:hypothetical protein AB0N09_37900 [Streptomyces erythrochromogenes]|uniref:hypothetical protein n=1 Tax=Streptomyces erythrochromogenes TaxID=285574 RepID=UPI0034286C81